MQRPVAELAKDLEASIRRGHPWVFDRALRKMPRVASGEVVALARGGRRLAVGYADPEAPIAVRVLETDADAEVGAAWVRERARLAASVRLGDPRLAACDAVRAIHGEGDGMPGLVVDLYAGVAVVVFDGAGADGFWRPRAGDVLAGLRDAGMNVGSAWLKPQRRGGGSGELLDGDEPPALVVIEENGARYGVDVRRGQKTGFFLDQRDNRRIAGELAAGADVLNLFAYTGGFSVQAALGGARRVVTVDLAAGAVAAARDNFSRSGLEPTAHRFEAADAFEFIARERAAGARYDLVICDPPSFAPSARARGRALDAYRRLNAEALGLVAGGGVLLTASCSSHIGEVDLIDCVAEAAVRAGRRLRLRQIRGAATDHPVRPAFPEGRYLTLLECAVE